MSRSVGLAQTSSTFSRPSCSIWSPLGQGWKVRVLGRVSPKGMVPSCLRRGAVSLFLILLQNQVPSPSELQGQSLVWPWLHPSAGAAAPTSPTAGAPGPLALV